MPAYAGIQILDSGFRRNDDASVGVLNPIENKPQRMKSAKYKIDNYVVILAVFASPQLYSGKRALINETNWAFDYTSKNFPQNIIQFFRISKFLRF
jgi:hypothetical protein